MAGTNEKSRFSDASQRPSPETTLSMQRCQACWVQSLLHTHVHVHAHAHGHRVNQSSPFLMHHPPNSTPPQPHLKPFLVPYLSFQFLHILIRVPSCPQVYFVSTHFVPPLLSSCGAPPPPASREHPHSFFIARKCCIVWTFCNFLNHLSTDGHLDCFRSLASQAVAQ